MLNIFADALLIATRLGHVPNPTPHTRRRGPVEFQDIEGLRTGDKLRSLGR
jgi:hypothetical protein